MRLKQHINEDLRTDTFILFMTNILRDCRPFLRELNLVGPKFLYSGRKRDTGWFEQLVRSDRKPKDLSKDIHTDFDNEFNKQFGWRPRSNGLFCSGDLVVASEYGKEYMIFPKGQFKFVWSDRIADLYIYLQRQAKSSTAGHEGNVLYQFFYNKLAKEMSDAGGTPDGSFVSGVTAEYEKFVTTTVNSYQSTNLTEAIDSKHEVIIGCQTYYAVRQDMWHRMVYQYIKDFGIEKMEVNDELLKWVNDKR